MSSSCFLFHCVTVVFCSLIFKFNITILTVTSSLNLNYHHFCTCQVRFHFTGLGPRGAVAHLEAIGDGAAAEAPALRDIRLPLSIWGPSEDWYMKMRWV